MNLTYETCTPCNKLTQGKNTPHVDTARNGLSHKGQAHHRHTQPMWYSPQRTLTHGASTSLTHAAHVVQSVVDSHAWDKYITDTRSPSGTVRCGLSRMGQVHHRHMQPMWHSPQRTLTHGSKPKCPITCKMQQCIYPLRVVSIGLLAFWTHGVEQFDLFLQVADTTCKLL